MWIVRWPFCRTLPIPAKIERWLSTPALAILLVGSFLFSSKPVFPLEGNGEGPPSALSRLEQHALRNLPELQALRHELEAQQALLESAGILEDPRLEVEVRRLAGSDDDMPQEGMIHWVQEFPPAGVRHLERKIAVLRVEQAKLELAQAEAVARARVLTAASKLFVARETLLELEKLHRNLEASVEVARQLLATDQADLGNWLAAFRALARHQEEMEEARTQAWLAQAELRSVSAWPEAELLPELDRLPDLGPLPSAEALAPRAFELRKAEVEIRLAASELELARAELHPRSMAGAGLIVSPGGKPDLSIRWGLEMPVFRKRRELSRIRALESRLEAARSRKEMARLNAERSLLELLAQLDRADRLRSLYLQELLPLNQALLEAQALRVARGKPALLEADLLEQETHDRLTLLKLHLEGIRVRSELIARFDLDTADPKGEQEP